MSFIRDVNIHDSTGNTVGSLSGALNTHDADVHNIVINKLLHQHAATATTLSVATVGDGTEYQLTFTSVVGFAAGDYLHIGGTPTETTHAKILAIVGNVVTLDRRIDFAHTTGTSVAKAVVNMASQIGTLATPQEYFIAPSAGEVWHLTRLLFSMTSSSNGDLGTFSGIPALTNGVLLKVRINGQYGTFSNWKTNADIKADMFDVEFDTRAGGGGTYGVSGRGTFTAAGAIVRLDGDTNDRVEVYIQDDLTGVNEFTMKLQGHTES